MKKLVLFSAILMSTLSFSPAFALDQEPDGDPSSYDLELLEVPDIPEPELLESEEGPLVSNYELPIPSSIAVEYAAHSPGNTLPVEPPKYESEGSVVRRGRAYSPARCTGSTDYPHGTTKDYIRGRLVPTEVSVHGRITCRYAVSRLETVTIIVRDRWYGPELVASDPAKQTNSRTSKDATPHKKCLGTGTFSYRGFSQHASLENGKIYRSTTRNWQIPGMSRFTC